MGSVSIWNTLKSIKVRIGVLKQNHRIAEFGRGLWKSCPILLLKQSHLEQLVQDCVWTDFECLQECRLHNLSEQPVPVTLTMKKFSLFSDRNTYLVCTHCFLSCHWTPPKESWLVFFYPPVRCWYTSMRSYGAFSCSPGCTVLTINLSSYEMLQPLNCLRNPLLASLQYFPMDWAAQNWTHCSRRSLTGAE